MAIVKCIHFLVNGWGEFDLIYRVTVDEVGWNFLNMEVRRIDLNNIWFYSTLGYEVVFVILGGICNVRSDKGEWEKIGSRVDVWSGMLIVLYFF